MGILRLILFCFNAAWTTLFATTYLLFYVDGSSHILANVASSVAWLLVTTVLWVSSDRFWKTKTHCAAILRVLRLGSCTTPGQEATVQDERRYRDVDSR
jgi:hypothetical protein